MIERFAETRVREALADTPVVALVGPRQCGKTTLAQAVRPEPYVTLDDDVALDLARTRPAAFVASHARGALIDEVQRAPGVFRALKSLVDKDRSPGKFLVTGSANLLLLPKLAESLAGRMETIDLWPLSQGEVEGRREGFVPWAFSDEPPEPIDPAVDWRDRLNRGGFPEPAQREGAARREAWFSSYVRALVERDVRDLARVDGVVQLPRLLRAVATEPYAVVNVTSLSRVTAIPPSTVNRYLSLLEAVYLVRSIPAWSGGEARVAKSPRLALVDSGVADYLAPGQQEAFLSNFVCMELVKQCAWLGAGHTVSHFRSARQYALPVVVQGPGGKCVGVSVVADKAVAPADFQALRFFQAIAGQALARGVVFYLGDTAQAGGDGLWALPLSALWRT
ncbi:MAG: ATP-binding protein [Fimbriimonadaceae bacterium]|nr:ATP-binding protein [Fimbriimonadaceae bacterium]